ncbi:glycosyltransferase [Spirosoma taeanense]|uniref:Glycosyltransferase n=1 Tax=Spirosoma taeanense TaxID=2735870 RepID=A0A6M5YDY5_9BACT|nr:glycosyltransferase [Spirosoma taeanense]QJW91172.1 glycosyltransferase [Spirosoma taeanense]
MKSISSSIDSIIRQSWKHWELIIIDDKSTDGTQGILEIYANKDHRIKIFYNEINCGLAYCLNKAIKLSKGEFIARMDSDDISFSKRLEKQVDFLMRNPNVDVLGTGAQLVNSEGKLVSTLILPSSHAGIVSQRYLKPFFIHPSVMFRADFFERFGGYNEKLRKTEDLDLWLRVRRNASFHNLPEVLFQYTYKPILPFKTFYSDFKVRFIHMLESGELLFKGYELILYLVRFLLLTYTPYISKSSKENS